MGYWYLVYTFEDELTANAHAEELRQQLRHFLIDHPAIHVEVQPPESPAGDWIVQIVDDEMTPERAKDSKMHGGT